AAPSPPFRSRSAFRAPERLSRTSPELVARPRAGSTVPGRKARTASLLFQLDPLRERVARTAAGKRQRRDGPVQNAAVAQLEREFEKIRPASGVFNSNIAQHTAAEVAVFPAHLVP